MKTLFEVLKEKKPISRKGGERGPILKELYDLYASIQDKKLRHAFNVGNYKVWLRSRKEKHSPLNWIAFRKSYHYIPTLDMSKFCIRLAILKDVRDLYYLLSVAKDRHNRGSPVGAYIFSSIKTKKLKI